MSQTLMVRFGADVSRAKQAVSELGTSVSASSKQMTNSLRESGAAAEMAGTALRLLLAAVTGGVVGVVAFVALQAAIAGTAGAAKDAAAELEKLTGIANQAQNAGVGTTFLQSWLAQAKELNMEVSALSAALTNAGNAAAMRLGTNGGSNSSAMRDRLELHQKAGNITDNDVSSYKSEIDQEGRIRSILSLIERLQEEGRQLAALDLARTMFGSDFEDKMRAGADVVGKMQESLKGIAAGPGGRIIPPDEIERAQKISDALDKASRIMNEAMKPLQEDLARWSQEMALSWAEIKVHLAEGVKYMMQAYQWVQSIGESISQWQVSQYFKDAVGWLRQMGVLSENIKIPGLEDKKDDTKSDGSPAPLAVKVKAPKDRSNPLPGPAKQSTEAKETDPVDTFIAAIERSSAALKAETDAFNKSNSEKRIAIDLAKAEAIAKQHGTELTAEQTERIKSASAAVAQYRDKLADLEQAQRLSAEVAKNFGDVIAQSLGRAILNGEKLKDILLNVSSMLGQQSLNAALTGTGPLAGFFGTAAKASDGPDAVGGVVGLARTAWKESGAGDGITSFFKTAFDGFRANGGPVTAGRAYRVNELGQEWFVPSTNGRIVSARDAEAGGAPWAASAAMPPVTVHFRVDSPDAAGFARSEGQITAALARAVQRGMRGN